MKVRSDILRTYQSVHTWAGIIAGLLLFIGFYAGALTMFKPELTQWATPPAHQLAPVPDGQLQQLFDASLDQYPDSANNLIVSFTGDQSSVMWFVQGGGRGLRLSDTLRHASFDANGNLTTTVAPVNELGRLIDELHRTAGIPGHIGHESVGVVLMGIAGVLYFVALVSGIIFLLPSLVKSFFALRKNKGANRYWLDIHNLIGVVSLPFHLLIAWTIIVFAFHDLLYDGLQVVYGDKPLFERGQRSEVVYHTEQLRPLNDYSQFARDLAPDYTLTSMQFSNLNSTSPSLMMHLKGLNKMQRAGQTDVIYMQPYTMDITYTSVNTVDNQPFGPIVKTLFSLHFGNFAGDTGRWLYFGMGILGAILFYTGNLLWLEKRRQKKGAQTRASRIMAALTVGVSLGSILGLVTCLLTTRWIYLLTNHINTGYLAVYYVVFFASLALCFLRGAPRGAIILQYALAVSCLAIPLTSLAGIFGFQTMWAPAGPSGLTIEVMALLFAGVFWRMAKRTRERAFHGESQSIWSLREPEHEQQMAVRAGGKRPVSQV